MTGKALYSLQLRLKRNVINHQRKKEEINGLLTTYRDEIQQFITTIYNSAVTIYDFLYPDSMVQEENDEHPKIEPNAGALVKIKDNFDEFLKDNIQNGRISKAVYIQILSLFNFCWNKESVEDFVKKMLTTHENYQAPIAACLLSSPLLQAYVISVFKNVFKEFEVLNVEQLTNKTIDVMKQYSQILPNFAKVIIQKKPQIFWSKLFLQFLRLPYLFGLANHEIEIFYSTKLDQFVKCLTTYFMSKPSTSFFNQLAFSKDVCIYPLEQLIRQIDASFVPQTLITPEFAKVQAPKFIQYSYTPFVATSPEKVKTPGLIKSVRSLLQECDLICLETNETNPKVILQQLVSLTTYVSNIKFEAYLEEIDNFIHSSPYKQDINTIIKTINRELDGEYESNSKDPLVIISHYSKQFNFIKKLNDLLSSIGNRAQILKERRILQTKLCLPAVEELINPADFILSFLALKDYLQLKKQESFRTLHSLLLSKIGFLNKDYTDVVSDGEFNTFLIRNRNVFLEVQYTTQFLKPYIKDPRLLDVFFNEFNLVFKTKLPLLRAHHIHNSITILIGYLKDQNIGEIGADQIIPFGVVATVLSNNLGYITTKNMIVELIQPLMNNCSPLDSAEEYSVIQFLSTIQYLQDYKKLC